MNFSGKLWLSAAAVCAVALVGCGKDKEEPQVAAPAAGEAPVVEEVAPAADVAEEEAVADEPEAPAPEFADDDVLVEAYGAKLTYADATKIMKRMMKAQGVPEEQVDKILPQMAGRAIPQLCEQFVVTAGLKDAAKKAGFKCEDADVQGVFSNMTERLPAGKTLDEALEMMGTSREEAAKEIAEGVPVTKLFESLCKGSEASDEAVAKFYEEHPEYFETPEQVRASHILVSVADKTNETAKAEARAKIEGLLKQVREGADFAELAKANSDCPSKERGGDLGMFGHGQMVPEFDKAAFALATNEVSDVVETSFGFHIIKLTERQEAGKMPFDEVAPMIRKNLDSQAKNEIVEGYVESLTKKLEYKANDKLSLFPKDDEEMPEAAPAAEEAAPAVESAPAEVPAAEAAPVAAPAAEAAPAPVAE